MPVDGAAALAPVVLDDNILPTTNLNVVPDHNGENVAMGSPKVLLLVEAGAQEPEITKSLDENEDVPPGNLDFGNGDSDSEDIDVVKLENKGEPYEIVRESLEFSKIPVDQQSESMDFTKTPA